MTITLATSPTPPSHTTTTTAYNHHNHHTHLLHLLNQCTSISHLKQIHAQTLRTTPTHHHHYSGTTLFLHTRILHFSSLHDLTYTFQLFNQIRNPNSFTFNTLIRACARSNDHKDQAIALFHKMLSEGNVEPDKHTFPFVLKACAYLFAKSEGTQLHSHVLKNGFGADVYINNSLIHFYASCGCLKHARDVFENMPERSVVSWNVMIDALVQLGDYDGGLRMFIEMQRSFEPDGYTMQSVIGACSGLGVLSLGMWAHAYVLRKCDRHVCCDVLVNNSLVDMYCKCGSLGIAKQVFERMLKHDVNSWNSLILGFAMHGQVEAALEYFDCMVNEAEIMPNSITFVGVLSACNHRGLVSEGQKYFDVMISEYKIRPVLEHFGCLVDLHARAGLVKEALDIVSNMPMKPDVAIWRSLLDACCKTNAGVELSEEVARQAMELKGDECSGVYVLLSRMYASANLWNEVGLVRKLMVDKGVKKEPGCSSIEMAGVTYKFSAGDMSHPQTKEIYQVLEVIEERLR